MQWDPLRALSLLDGAIGLGPELRHKVIQGTEGLPLWDYRRIAVCSATFTKCDPGQSVLLVQRLQPLFDQKHLHEGGNFGSQSLELLHAAISQGNFCAQTTLGLLLAATGRYWDVARAWACCDQSVQKGVETLFIAAIAGDLEAATALSHIWTSPEHDSTEVFNAITLDHVHTLFKIAVTTQNASAVLNLGAMWRYGAGDIVPNLAVANDAFLMALQGSVTAPIRNVAATHLSQTLRGSLANSLNSGIQAMLSSCMEAGKEDVKASHSPQRIDDFEDIT